MRIRGSDLSGSPLISVLYVEHSVNALHIRININ